MEEGNLLRASDELARAYMGLVERFSRRKIQSTSRTFSPFYVHPLNGQW